MSERKRYVRAVLKDLLDRYISGSTNYKEQKLVEHLYDAMDRGKSEADNLERIGEEIKAGVQQHIGKRRVSPFRLHTAWYAAASLLVVLGIYISYRIIDHHNTADKPKQSDRQNPSLFVGSQEHFDLLDTLPPGSHYTTINEEKVLALGTLTQMADNSKLRIENPSRRVFSVLLDDSTQVWLNYMASLELDPNFNKGNRSVHVVGEVFFDVHKQYARGRKVPFLVHSSLQTIEVLGTKFNVNTSNGLEENVLLNEGSIQLTHNQYGTRVLIKPGQQAFIQKDKPKILLIQAKNVEKANAWRKGLFYFDNENFEDVVLELGQWYGAEIDIDPAIANLPITGMISRYEDIREVLNIIKMTNNINYSEKKGKIYVTQANP
jgi:Fe2+-dicitrate sensor, membrane component